MKQLELADDGRVIIRSGAEEWVLRRPTLGEYRHVVELAQAADDKLREAVEAVPEGPNRGDEQIRISGALQVGSADQPPLYGSVIQAYVGLLAPNEPPDVDALPSWAVSSKAAARMIGHWRAVPLDLGPDVPAP